MLAAKVVLLLVLLPVCVFSPGFFLVRKLRWSPLEKLCGSVGLSLILLYLVSFGTYWLSRAVRGILSGRSPPARCRRFACCWDDGHPRCIRAGIMLSGSTRPPWLFVLADLDADDSINDPALLGRRLGRRLAGTFSADAVLPAPLSKRNSNHRRLSASGRAAHDEPPRTVRIRRSLRVLPWRTDGQPWELHRSVLCPGPPGSTGSESTSLPSVASGCRS